MKINKLGFTFDDVLLVPKKTSLSSRSRVDLSTQLTAKIKLKIPLVSANMDTVTESRMAIALARLGGIGIIHRFLSIDHQVEKVKKVKRKGLLVGAAIGIKDGALTRAEALIKAKVDVIVLDIAHGHSAYLLRFLKRLVKKFKKAEFIAGNVATAEATRELINAGAAAIKVGIGPGALCSTRVVAGAGASSVMIGTLFAGCEESPALAFFKHNKRYELTRGMASVIANYDRQLKDEKIKQDLKNYSAEGVEAFVAYHGSVADMIDQLLGGIRSGFSYSGARNMKELWQKAEFIRISQNGLVESHPHDIQEL